VKGEEDVNRMKHQIPAGAKLGLSIKTPAMAVHSENMITAEVAFVNIEIDPLVQLSMGLKSPDHALHSAVLGMIRNVRERCGLTGTVCCVTLGDAYATDWNIEMLSKEGVDVLCVEPGTVENVKNVLSRIGKAQEPAASGDFPLDEGINQTGQDRADPFGFSPSSFS
jgi:phosphoenolpyruvate-protein kinase (PTS system EI component)